MVLAYSLIATFIVSLISLVGIISLFFQERVLDKILVFMIGFAAGSLIGVSFLHILPEALEVTKSNLVFMYTVMGFSFFFIMEKYFHWRHCHEEHCDVHPFTYLILAGDSVHNFIDGLVIVTSFAVNFNLGVMATIAIIMHEIPQELGDFSVLIYGGLSKPKALFYNFLSALMAVLGAVIGYFAGYLINLSNFLLPFAAGGFIYIGASDLLPELHKQKSLERANISLISFFAGIIFMWLSNYIGKMIH